MLIFIQPASIFIWPKQQWSSLHSYLRGRLINQIKCKLFIYIYIHIYGFMSNEYGNFQFRSHSSHTSNFIFMATLWNQHYCPYYIDKGTGGTKLRWLSQGYTDWVANEDNLFYFIVGTAEAFSIYWPMVCKRCYVNCFTRVITFNSHYLSHFPDEIILPHIAKATCGRPHRLLIILESI